MRFLIKIFLPFIPSKNLRNRIKEKYHIKSKISKLTDIVNKLSAQVENLTRLVSGTVDVSNLPRAKGFLRTVQLLNLDILKEIDRICRKHDIAYWLDFGTLLGAVRHKGFIPWDDDIDIGMLYDDYIKFQHIAEKELEGTPFVIKTIPSHICKVLHKEFMPETEKEWIDFANWNKSGKLCFCVDIFPYYYKKEEMPKQDLSAMIISELAEKKKAYNSDLSKSFAGLQSIEKKTSVVQRQCVSPNRTQNIFLGMETINEVRSVILDIDDIFPLHEMVFETCRFFVPYHAEIILYGHYGDFYRPTVYENHLFFGNLSTQETNRLIKYEEAFRTIINQQGD